MIVAFWQMFIIVKNKRLPCEKLQIYRVKNTILAIIKNPISSSIGSLIGYFSYSPFYNLDEIFNIVLTFTLLEFSVDVSVRSSY